MLMLIAYYYFDFKDASKRGLHGLLTSLLFQLGDDDEHLRDIFYQLYKTCRDGSEQPSDAALVKCLETMLDLPGQLPIFIIIDALDECPSSTGTPSAREVLNFVEMLVGSNRSNPFMRKLAKGKISIAMCIHFSQRQSNAEMERGGQGTRHHNAL
jgi:hypothetical protein